MKSLLFFVTFSLIFLSGCSTKELVTLINDTSPSQNSSVEEEFQDEFSDEMETEIDPFSGHNEFMTNFNDSIITYALNPASEAYAFVIPEALRIGISNAFHNIQFPIRVTNNLLQGKFENVSDETGRFIVNSTLGIAGLMDPAKEHLHLMPHNEDFGQTLGFYGVQPGYHIVLPFLGPSNVRDIIGITVDGYTSPLVNTSDLENYKIPDNLTQTVVLGASNIVNKNSLNLGQYESIKKDALELYPFLRDVYEQKRISDIEE